MLLLICAFLFIPFLISKGDTCLSDEVKGTIDKTYKRGFKIAVVLFVLSFLSPSQKEMLLLTGGWVAINNEEVQKLPENVLGAMNSYLETIQKEMKDVETSTDVKNPKEVAR
jgi:hypothetical protein